MIDVEMLRPTADEMLSGLSADEAMKQRLLFTVNAVDKLPAIATEMLGGLKATPALRHRILVKADRKKRASTPAVAPRQRGEGRFSLGRAMPVLSMALVMVIMIGLGVNYGGLGTPNTLQDLPGDLGSYTLGSDVPTGGSVPQFRSLFVQGQGANPPLIGVHGRFYRMLNVPVSQDLIGSPIAEIQDFTDEPSLAATVGIVSNVVKPGTMVYSVDGGLSSKTACIAEVDGVPRLFQRVGYASTTFIGGEQFKDTLDVGGKVSALELSGVGVIMDEDIANDLIYTLCEFAVYSGTDIGSQGQALTIYLNNGLSLQLMVEGDVISGCGAWACPEFFDYFHDEVAL